MSRDKIWASDLVKVIHVRILGVIAGWLGLDGVWLLGTNHPEDVSEILETFVTNKISAKWCNLTDKFFRIIPPSYHINANKLNIERTIWFMQ